VSPILGIYASQISGHLFAPSGAYDSIATTTVGSNTSSVTFSAIPSGYTHLQIRAINFTSSANSNIYTRFNSDTGNNYASHQLTGDGSSPLALGNSSISFAYPSFSPGGTYPGVFIMDLLDYTNTNKNKTFKSLWGYDNNGSGWVGLNSGVWLNTNAVTSITFGHTVGGATINSGSQFALYGIKGA
jgi:hypothetical protein